MSAQRDAQVGAAGRDRQPARPQERLLLDAAGRHVPSHHREVECHPSRAQLLLGEAAGVAVDRQRGRAEPGEQLVEFELLRLHPATRHRRHGR